MKDKIKLCSYFASWRRDNLLDHLVRFKTSDGRKFVNLTEAQQHQDYLNSTKKIGSDISNDFAKR